MTISEVPPVFLTITSFRLFYLLVLLFYLLFIIILDSQISVDNLNPVHNNVLRSSTGPQPKSIQERCGINTTFPGITEYMKRYNRKGLPEKLTNYNINPTPDFSLYGRPTAKVCPNKRYVLYLTYDACWCGLTYLYKISILSNSSFEILALLLSAIGLVHAFIVCMYQCYYQRVGAVFFPSQSTLSLW